MSAPLTPSMLRPSASGNWPVDAVPESWIDSLFARMSSSYGSKFADLWRGTDLMEVRRLWGVELAHLTREEMRRGVESLRTRPFPPTLPEFFNLCKPPVNFDAALHEATQQLRLRAEGRDEWTNPAFYWAALKVGEFDMMNLSHAILIKRYTAALNEVMAGAVDPVPPRLVALPAPGQTRAQPEKVEAEMTKVRATRKEAGNKRWAQRIVDRAKTEKGAVTITVLNMARAALGIKAEAV